MNWTSQISELHAEMISREIFMPFAISSETLSSVNFVLVKITDENGIVGIGEASPFPTLTGDNVDGVFPIVKEILDQLREMTPLGAVRFLRTIRDEFFMASPSAFVGVEMAVWDLYAKQLGVPLAAIWGGRMYEGAKTDITLPIMTPMQVEKFWDLFEGHGFSVIKIKVSGNVESDLDMIHAIMKLIPRNTQITLDGNQGYRIDQARMLLAALSEKNIHPLFFEQPLVADDWDGLKILEQSTGTPVCLDETVMTPEDAIKVVRDQTASMINLKIMKSGIEETMRIISIARSAGITLMIGGMLESEIAMGASLQLACGMGGVNHFDLDTPFFMKSFVCKESPWHARSAQLRRPNKPGIGLDLT